MSKAKVTLTQQKIKEELERRGYRQMDTIRPEYIKFQVRCTTDGLDRLWVGRKGEIRQGRRLPTSEDITLWPVGAELKRAAKANYLR